MKTNGTHSSFLKQKRLLEGTSNWKGGRPKVCTLFLPTFGALWSVVSVCFCALSPHFFLIWFHVRILACLESGSSLASASTVPADSTVPTRFVFSLEQGQHG